MPIYAYRCATCGHAKDVLQKVSDALLITCPACGAQDFQKQVTAAGFQLKGSGWYVTDFKGDANKKPVGDAATKSEAGGDAAKGDAAKGDAAKGDAAKRDAKTSEAGGAKAESAATTGAKTSEKSQNPASRPASVPASTPAAGSGAAGGGAAASK